MIYGSSLIYVMELILWICYFSVLKYCRWRNLFYTFQNIRTTKHSKKEIRATITPEMWDIIHKWGNPNISPQTYIFKYAKGMKMLLKRSN